MRDVVHSGGLGSRRDLAGAPATAAPRRPSRYKGKVVFVGLDIQDFKSDARAFLRRYGVDYVSVRDGTEKTYGAYGLTGVPETYYLDARGRAVDHAVGAVSKRELTQGVRQLLESSR